MDYHDQLKRDMDAATIRRQQIEDGRRMTEQEKADRRTIAIPAGTKAAARAPAPVQRGSKEQSPTVKAKGHEAFLKALQLSNADIIIEMISSGRIYHGKLKHSDKYTLTVNVTAVQESNEQLAVVRQAYDHVLFKHDISEFYTTTPRIGAAA